MYLNEHPSISITLSPTQVDEVLRAAAQSRAPSVSAVVSSARRGSDASAAGDTGDGKGARPARRRRAGGTAEPAAEAGGYLPGDTADWRLSRSLLRGLSILTCFNADGEARGIVELARDLEMSPSTAHRYALTLVELGLLERCPRTRKYRLPGTEAP